MLTFDLACPPDATHLCLVLHGLGDSRQGWKPVAGMLAIPRLGWCFAQAPKAYYDGWSWFDLSPDFVPSGADVRESRAQVRQLIDHLLATTGLPAERLFLMGFSQGCLMTLDVGLRDDRQFAGLIGISGWLAQAQDFPGGFGTAARTQAIFWSHGTADSLIPIEAPRRNKDYLQELGCQINWRVYDKEHSLDPVQELGDVRAFLRQRMG